MAKDDILKDYRYDGTRKLDLSSVPHDSEGRGGQKEEYAYKTDENIKEIDDWQGKLYAQSQESVLIILQALDAAGKDGTIKHVLGPLNPQGISVHSFKAPNSEEEQQHAQADLP